MSALFLIPRLRAFRRRLARATGGVAMTEFAMSLPVLLTLGLLGLETANYVLAHLKVSNIASLTADNASRVRGSIDETDVAELFTGALMAGQSIQFAQNGRIILSDLEMSPADSTKQWIRWQRCAGALTTRSSYGVPRRANDNPIRNGTEETAPSSHLASTSLGGFGPAGNQIAAQSGTAVMVAEVVYNYQPIVAGDLLGSPTIRYLSAFNVRQRTNQVLTNSTNMIRASCG